MEGFIFHLNLKSWQYEILLIPIVKIAIPSTFLISCFSVITPNNLYLPPLPQKCGLCQISFIFYVLVRLPKNPRHFSVAGVIFIYTAGAGGVGLLTFLPRRAAMPVL